MSQDALAYVLRHMAMCVEQGDSFEGSIEYLMPIPEEEGQEFPEGTYALVQASYRIGNLDGQGSVRMIGEMR
jgi:hypothetical protein